jgi:hypothetical protein
MSPSGRKLQKVLVITALCQWFGILLTFIGCGTPTQPPSIVGNWSGTVTNSLGQTGSAALYLTEDRHGILEGTFSYEAGDCSVNSEPVLGKAAGAQVSLSQSPSDPVLTSLKSTADAAEQHFSGSYSNTNGFCSSAGTVSLAKP